MASAARAYRTNAAPKRGASLRVLPGGRDASGLSPAVLFAARLFIMLLSVFAIVACVRIGLASATVSASVEAERLNTQVEQVRSGSAHLEVTESTLANPATVKETAVKKLGMSAPYEIENMKLGHDVVAYDAEGNLALARSLAQGRAV